MTLSPIKKGFFCLIAILAPLVFIEFLSYGVIRLFFPQAYLDNREAGQGTRTIFRTDYRGNDFCAEDYDYRQDFFGPHLDNGSLSLAERLIGPRASTHYLRIDRYTLFPFTMFHLQRNYRSAVVNTNALGFRAGPLSDYARDTRPKIIVLGGSAIFGTFLSADKMTVSAQLESYLQEHGRDVACVSLAMGGYTSEQEMITLSRIGMRLNPATVIAINGYNDVNHYLRHRDLPHLYPELAKFFYGGVPPNSAPGVYLRGMITQLGQYSSFFWLAGTLAAQKASAASPGGLASHIENAVLFPEQSDDEAIVDNFLNAHAVMFSLCKARNIRYIAGLQPVCGIWVEPRWEGEENQTIRANLDFVRVYHVLDARLQALAEKEGFLYLNFGKILSSTDNKFNFSDSVHLTDMSAGIIARRLGEAILSQPAASFGAKVDRPSP